MIVAFDYDGTWTRDTAAFRKIAALLTTAGHTCIMVTGRMDEHGYGNEVRAAVGDLMSVIFAGTHEWKRDSARAAGYAVDVWIEDNPEYVAPQDPRRCYGKPALSG